MEDVTVACERCEELATFLHGRSERRICETCLLEEALPPEPSIRPVRLRKRPMTRRAA